MKLDKIAGYAYQSAAKSHSHDYLLPPVVEARGEVQKALGYEESLFEVGCGSSVVASALSAGKWSVTGVAPSEQEFKFAQETCTGAPLRRVTPMRILQGSTAMLSPEVVKHVYDPRASAASVFCLFEPNGSAAILASLREGTVKTIAYFDKMKADGLA